MYEFNSAWRRVWSAMTRTPRVYLDHASAPPLDRHSIEARDRAEFFYGNPGAVHEEGRRARASLEEARAGIARLLAVKKSEVIFTSGGTESNNLAILGFARSEILSHGSLEGRHFITDTLEHPSVGECFREIERLGGEVTYVTPNAEGLISSHALRDAVRPETVFASIAYVQGEIGTLAPMRDLVMALRESKKLFSTEPIVIHTDASQAPLYFDVTPHTLGVDLMTLDALKMHGPKGSGILFKRQSTRLEPILFGGSQEFGLRPGTENVGAAHAVFRVLHAAVTNRRERVRHVQALQTYALELLSKELPEAVWNGSLRERSPANINISIPGVDAEYAVVILDGYGIAAGTRSACLPHDGGGSEIVKQVSGDAARAKSAFRFTIGPRTSRDDIFRMVAALKIAATEARNS